MSSVSRRDIAQLVALSDGTLDTRRAARLRRRLLSQPDLARAQRQIARAREVLTAMSDAPAPQLPYGQVEAQIRWHLAHDPGPSRLRRLWKTRPRRALALVAVALATMTLAASVGTALYHRETRARSSPVFETSPHLPPETSPLNHPAHPPLNHPGLLRGKSRSKRPERPFTSKSGRV